MGFYHPVQEGDDVFTHVNALGRVTMTGTHRRARLLFGLLAPLAIGAPALLTPTPAHAAPAPAHAAPAPAPAADGSTLAPAAGQGPWRDPGYTPTPGNWQPYVLAPTSRLVRPASVQAARPQQGSIAGDPASVLSTDGAGVTLTSTGPAYTSPLLTVDFGQDVGGYIRLRVLPGAAPTIPEVHVCFSETTRYMAAPTATQDQEGYSAPGCDLSNILNGYSVVNVANGQQVMPWLWDSESHTLTASTAVTAPTTFTDPQLRGGFRYATIFLNGAGSVTVDSIQLQFAAAPNQADMRSYPGWFLSSDNLLNKIWYAGAYTEQLDTARSNTAKSWPYTPQETDRSDSQVANVPPDQEVVFDGAKRDRQVWQGDMAVEAPVAYLSTNDKTSVDNTLTALGTQQNNSQTNYLPNQQGFGEYVEWFVNNMYQHYLWTGDKAFLDTWYSRVLLAMNWLEGQRDPATGLIAFDSSGATGDYGYTGHGHMTYTNSLYVMNLKQVAELAAVEADGATATQDTARVATVATAINAHLWDPAAGAYRYNMEGPTQYPQDANSAVILAGVASPDQAASTLQFLKTNNWTAIGSVDAPTGTSSTGGAVPPYYEQLPSYAEVMSHFQAGSAADAVDLMKRFWGYQLSQEGPQSTMWETLNNTGAPASGPFTSLAHAWGSGPTIALTTELLGVKPVTDGFATYRVQPHPAGVTWAQGDVPTPHGALSVGWSYGAGSFGEEVTAPAGTVGSLAIPIVAAAPRITVNGQTVWSNGSGQGFGAHSDGTYVVLEQVPAGTYVINETADAGATIPGAAVVPLYFHNAASDLKPATAANGGMTMDATAPTGNAGPPPGAPYQSWPPGNGTGPHDQWATPALQQLGLGGGATLTGYGAQVYINCSIPGQQPAGVATVNVDLYRVDGAGASKLISQDSVPLQALSLNQTALITVPAIHLADVALGPFDRLVADVYMTGARAAFMNLTYDDVSFASGVSLSLRGVAPTEAVPELPAPGVLLLPVLLAVTGPRWLRRRSR